MYMPMPMPMNMNSHAPNPSPLTRRHVSEDAVLVAAVTEADRLEAWG